MGNVSSPELAGILGVSRAAVTKAKKSGRITPNEDGTFDEGQAVAGWKKNTGPRVNSGAKVNKSAKQVNRSKVNKPGGGRAPAQANKAYNDARTKREQYQADLARLELEEKQGKSLKTDEVVRTWAGVLRLVKERLMAFPERLGHLVAAESDASRCVEIIRGEVRALLTEIVGSARNGKRPH